MVGWLIPPTYNDSLRWCLVWEAKQAPGLPVWRPGWRLKTGIKKTLYKNVYGFKWAKNHIDDISEGKKIHCVHLMF